jgi:hypothetical protein
MDHALSRRPLDRRAAPTTAPHVVSTAYAETLADLVGGIRAAQNLADPNWSTQAQLTARGGAARAARERAGATLGSMLEAARQTEARELTKARKALTETSDPVTLTRRQQAWERVRMLAEAGRTLSDLIAETSDPVTLAGIYEWAPSWVRAQSIPPGGVKGATEWSEPDTSWIEAQTFTRLAEVEGTSSASHAITAATAERQVAETYAAAAEAVTVDGRLTLGARSALFRADPTGAPLAQAAELTTTVSPTHTAAAQAAAQAALTNRPLTAA